MKRLAIIITHPIQYHSPIFQMLTKRRNITLKVFYSWHANSKQYDKGFQREISWDIPLLVGYDYYSPTTEVVKKRNFFSLPVRPIITAIKTWQPNALLVFGWNFYAHLKIMSHFKGLIPIYFRGDSTLLDNTSGFKNSLKKFILKKIYTRIDQVAYVGTNNKKYFQYYGLKEEQLNFIPHAIDNNRFRESPLKNYEEQASQWREKLGITNKDRVLLYAGKLEPKKAPDLLIDAFIELHLKNTILIIIGEGKLEMTLKKKAKSYSTIIFIPFQNQSKMPIIYRIGDVFILPSMGPGETWGLAINEAMACGRPVIISDKVGCGADLVITDKTGWSFEANNKDALKTLLKKVSMAPSKQLKRMGIQAQTTIIPWNFETICDGLEKIVLDED